MAVIDDEALKWALLHVDGRSTAAERAQFEAWFAADTRHAGAYGRARAIHNALARATVQEDLRPKVEVPAATTSSAWPARRRFLALGGMAACVAVIGYPLLRSSGPQGIMLATARGEFRNVPLADRSVASIAGGSRIEVLFTDTARQVRVHAGEAWFDVAKDPARPFIVEAAGVRARAVGTAFGVRREDKGAEILVTHGVVAVSNGAAARGTLHAGERAIVAGNAARIEVENGEQEVQRRLAWREGNLVFMNQPLEQAVADFNRYGARTIVIGDRRIARRTLLGRYRIDAPERFAQDVAAFLNVPVSITAREIRIGQESAR